MKKKIEIRVNKAGELKLEAFYEGQKCEYDEELQRIVEVLKNKGLEEDEVLLKYLHLNTEKQEQKIEEE